MPGMHQVEVEGDVNYIAKLSDGTFLTINNDDPAKIVDLATPKPERWVSTRVSTDGGQTWSAPRKAFAYPAGLGQAMPTTCCADQKGRIHVFGLRFFGLERDNPPHRSHIVHTVSDDGGETWIHKPAVDFGHDYTGSINNVLVLESGRIVLPLSYFAPERESGLFVSMTVFSDDGGETWGRSNDCAVDVGGAFLESGAAEPVVVQLNSGVVWMIIRTVTGLFWESFSSDGAHWSMPRPTRIMTSNAPAGVVRLSDGAIVMSWNNLYGEPMWARGISYARYALHMAISRDDGQTWSVPKEIAAYEPGDLPGHICYPYLFESNDGKIVAVYHRVRTIEGRDWHYPLRRVLRIDPAWLSSPNSQAS
jgi:hypothetical protein